MLVRLLGPFEVRDPTGPVVVRSTRQRTVLAALAMHAGRPVAVADLVDAVWPDDPPASARNSLQSHIARLRGVLRSSGAIVLDPAGYRLTADVDAGQFERLVRRGEHAAALELWRGPPLREFPDSPFREWAVRLTEMYRAVVASGSDSVALRTEVHADPCWEAGAVALAQSLVASGSIADAAAALRRHCEAVVERLGVDPSPRVRRLQAEILRGGAPERAGRPDGGGEFRSTVPLRFSSFVGRVAEKAQLAALLREPGLVSVVGPGGVGKTRLVAETTGASGRTAWVDAADVRDGREFVQAAAVVLGARLGPRDDPPPALARAAARLAAPVVLDNCEHVLTAVAAVAEALLVAGVRVVVTSQERLRVDGEAVLTLGPMPTADGVRLFHDRCPGGDDDSAPAEIVTALDGLPLAIELAATQAAVLGVEAVRDRLDDRLDLLDRGRRTGAARHRTLRAVAEWSYRLLPASEAVVLRRLSVFGGSFTMSLAEQVVAVEPVSRGRVAPLLASLIERSLVVRHGPHRYRLLETVRMLAAQRLDSPDTERPGAAGPGTAGPDTAGPQAASAGRAGSGDGDRIRARHAVAVVAAAEDLDVRMHGPDQAAAVREFDDLLPDLRRARTLRDPGLVVRLAAAMYRYGYHCQQYEVLAWGHDAVPVAGHPRRSVALAAAATHEWGRGDLTTARDLAARAGESSAAHEVLGDVALVSCDAPVALAHYRAMAGSAVPAVRVSGLCGAALVLAWTGSVAAAVAEAERARQIADDCANPSAMAEARYALGEALADTRPEEALVLLSEADHLAREVDDRLFRGASQTAAVAIRSRHGDPAPALASFREVLRLWRRAGNTTLQSNALRNLIVLLARVGEDETAALVDAALPPSAAFPAQAARLARARAAVAERLGARTEACHRRGAAMSAVAVTDAALSAIESATRRQTGHDVPHAGESRAGHRYG
ncbi:AfsR/SARP family transcriptional regulator [Mangrovihabitans endophyticus]|uniref:OmpR/PhoB-type domain-containing protein n=1 Tax=Mangrovihabitans endophyticus TaxID=1751298 RepID=A0A8J3BVI1_9ACTN|nr:winged helix-turn-helix domain-containing protein [Mangrovihabitans endophyticus]GGK81088.1 hypothetical protein GCM10012284_13790 [Mangrovihabitans endophyticus]